ncbi:hypothetical protein [Candidatus Methylacidithermus pantelleriae]|uniref:Uncharacterized protein n=1 Tax=Candidatus Methylacidithermus pantelleriae TaxID=2744239 RepID=A0A8J2BM43_9BACT|nr:hypothetical protein [Candidatus Methylacidithermus pantelleriae]CAF0698312.1 hypothetical protein MPNT_260005 [Candidatus Methylacidithermus pantelleriae]
MVKRLERVLDSSHVQKNPSRWWGRKFLVFLGWLVLGSTTALHGELVRVVSPDKVKLPQSQMVPESRSLHWNSRRGLSAVVTFSSGPYTVDVTQPPITRTYRFRLPGVTEDPKTGLLVLHGPGKRTIPVAKSRTGRVVPTPNAHLRIRSEDGLVSVELEANASGKQPVRSREWSY